MECGDDDGDDDEHEVDDVEEGEDNDDEDEDGRDKSVERSWKGGRDGLVGEGNERGIVRGKRTIDQSWSIRSGGREGDI